MAAKRHRLAQRRKTLGFTQEGLAERLGIDPTTVRRWESGAIEGGPQSQLRPKLARYLQVSAERLEELLNEPVTADGPPSALNVDEQQHVDAALVGARRYFDGPVVGYFRHQLDACMVDDGELGPTKTLPTVLGLLRAIEQHGREVQPAVRRELLSFGACGAEFAGWLYRDTNDPVRAGFWYDRATEWAQEAGDFPMQGHVLLKKSQMAYDARDPLRVSTLAQAAQDGPWQLPTRVRAEVTQQEALGMAMLGEPLPAVERKLDDARQLLVQTTADHEQPDLLGAYFNDSTLLLRNASSFTEAGKPGRAAVVFGDVLANASLSRRDTGYFRARRAAALALSGEPDEAARVG
ncbi:MAG: helix-turn-helix domain-containing protein [Actinomycetota bacterium]|nr:helix-turn-helix domain-containing protein [Actinomycetota bacterium]